MIGQGQLSVKSMTRMWVCSNKSYKFLATWKLNKNKRCQFLRSRCQSRYFPVSSNFIGWKPVLIYMGWRATRRTGFTRPKSHLGKVANQAGSQPTLHHKLSQYCSIQTSIRTSDSDRVEVRGDFKGKGCNLFPEFWTEPVDLSKGVGSQLLPETKIKGYLQPRYS